MNTQIRNYTLTYVARFGTLSPGITLAQANALTGAVENCGGGRWELTEAGWAEVERLGRQALGTGA